jgi:hypothetical protein
MRRKNRWWLNGGKTQNAETHRDPGLRQMPKAVSRYPRVATLLWPEMPPELALPGTGL